LNLEIFEEYFKVTESAHEMIAIIDREFKIIYKNHVFSDVLGYKSEEMNDFGPMDLIHPDDFENSIMQLRKTLMFGKGKVELRLMQENGHYLWVEIRGRSFLDKSGKKRGMMIAIDINERKIAELRLENSLKSLNQIYK